MIKKTLTFLFISFQSFGCLVSTPQTLVFENKPNFQELKSHIVFKNCNDDQSNRFLNFLSDFKGNLNHHILRVELPSITLEKSVTISRLSDYINSRLTKPKDWKVTNLKFSHANQTLIALNKSDTLSLECNNCSHTGSKTIKGTIVNPIDNSYKSLWFKGDLAVKTKSLVVSENIGVSNQPLSPSQLEVKTIYSKNPDRLFTNINQIVFYKLNKGKSKGEAIHYSDITPVNLVRVGQPVTILLKKNSLRLEGKATPHQSGKLGQVIRLKNNRTNKTVIGKIVDFNKVEVQL